ncbi:alcohol dehydrogenase catalytic domain-containing protein [Tunicatimonas pelagia]|uniref:alcohol dehydrogenase catalytic domain-containing protein n=1 Tax=Tunicatimonas pelagia TaxID=931531 RepID=UPI002666070D|nr:alcohol dehydrogenase catalytic domain-containing protein [Tunicatimonas pelagia]WKN46067.1 alcohol dehydrogenase catalytic domain-containing protein [Tunicatimonas pelagia]
MQQLTFLGKNSVAWQEVREPVLQSEQEAIVRPFAAARCDGDSFFLFHDYRKVMPLGVNLNYLDPKVLDVFGNPPLQPPFGVGHEAIGEVTEIGSAVKNVRRGDVVVVPWAISCGHCNPCRRQLPANCSRTDKKTLVSAYGFGAGMGDFGGMVSDKIRVPFADAMLVKIPEGVNPIHCASLSDNISDAYRSVGPQLDKFPEAPVLVFGGNAKSIGLYAAALAVAKGSTQVDYVDDNLERLTIAARVGANPIELRKKQKVSTLSGVLIKEGYPIVVDASGSVTKLAFGIQNLAPGGTATGVAFYVKKRNSLPLWEMYLRSATLHVGISHSRRDIPDVFPLIKSGKFKPEKITTMLADWSDAPEAYLELSTKLIIHRQPLNNSN